MTHLADQLLGHLEDERKAITRGSFSALTDLGAAKETLFAQLPTADLPPDVLALIGRRAKRNLQLLDAAMRGIKDTSNRLRDLRAVQAGFETYGANGQRTAHPSKRPDFERKA